MAKTPEDLLIRWVNFHLRRVCDHKQIKNFYKDIQDGEAYTYLLTAIAPQDTDLLPLRVSFPSSQFLYFSFFFVITVLKFSKVLLHQLDDSSPVS